ncbi:glucosaminidase domain-containing protein [Clostridium estertheticum]|uniref:N-acetylglucosaminidase n=1 Tax=Clostridium estertheticum TaxID=238834 RepID=UPI0013E92825|nr:glucosaminidase domain-containing protein [Clostridium estertheticum]MBZ9684922.1 glucosaminidase domain-containing protein [Clostridium estertheticum]
MLNKNSLNKVSLFLIVICGLFLFIPNTVIAAGNPTQWVQKNVKVEANKVWKIKFNQEINVDKLSTSVRVYNPSGLPVQIRTSYANNTITVVPVSAYIPGQTYSLQISQTITGLHSNQLKAPITMSFTIAVPDNPQLINTVNKNYVYKQYDTTLDQMVAIQSKCSSVNVVNNYYLTPSNIDIYQYLNPKNFEYHDYAVYQFLTLNYIEGITAEELNSVLKGKGILEGQGKTFLDACFKYDVNPAYAVAHAFLETGNGSSILANGVMVSEVGGQVLEESKSTYNMFGIGAFDIDPNKLGSERAYIEGWFTPELAIDGGVKWIATQYIKNVTYNQNTLYKMRWNPAIPANTYRHQYATDIAWAYKQSYRIKEILDKCTNANLKFEIPQYK